MAFVKLDSGLPDSSLWVDRDALLTFIWALCKAEPRELKVDTPALEVRSLEENGYIVPAGWYGFVRAAAPAISRAVDLDKETVLSALERLATPDPDSRNPDNEGRRMVRVDGGYVILNYDTYRQRDVTAAERMRRYRAHKSEQQRNVTRNDRNATANVTEAEAEAEAEADQELLFEEVQEEEPLKEKNKSSSSKATLSSKKQTVIKIYNSVAERRGWRKCSKVPAGEVGRMLDARVKDDEWMETFPEAMELAEGLDWMEKGKLETFIRADATRKILDGEWAPRSKTKPSSDDEIDVDAMSDAERHCYYQFNPDKRPADYVTPNGIG